MESSGPTRLLPKQRHRKLPTRWSTALGQNTHGNAHENNGLRVYLSGGERRADDAEPRLTRIRNWSYQQDVARTYNKKVRTKTFQQGDWVLRRADKTTGKLTPGWEGLYKVIEVRRAGAYMLQDSKVKIQPNSWNTLHLKAYHF